MPKTSKTPKPKHFDAFVMELHNEGWLDGMAAFNLTRFCTKRSSRDSFYQEFIKNVLKRVSAMQKHMTKEQLEEVRKELRSGS